METAYDHLINRQCVDPETGNTVTVTGLTLSDSFTVLAVLADPQGATTPAWRLAPVD